MCRDYRDPAYSVLARSLAARRDNLAATIAALEERLSRTEVRGIRGRGGTIFWAALPSA
jgi:hypothetical protein